jgi:chromosome segregation protein
MSQMFHDFFTAMFGGGKAELTIEEKVQTEEEIASGARSENGIGIRVKLPNKKVTEIEMLSGGERSLTSIALLFALSQVNPPPFLVLDETDAALDEANSRRYGDMLQKLSSVAQLVVVTHNRETMSRAQNLYGITMKNGASSVLSIKLEQATEVAK